jgi:GT2 family glycosyltransferase
VGFRAATGSYLTWTSDDNWYAETALERMLDCLKTNDHIGLVYAGSHLVDEAGAVTDTRTPRQLEDFASNPWNPVGACFLYRRQAYERVGEYDPVQRLVEDYDYWLRIADCFETAVIPDLLYYYRQHSSSLSAQYSLLASEKALRLLRSRGDLSDAAYRYWMSWLHQDAAYAAWKLAHSRRRAFRAVVRSMIFQPSSIIQRTLAYTLVWSILGDRLYEQLWRAKQQFVPHR